MFSSSLFGIIFDHFCRQTIIHMHFFDRPIHPLIYLMPLYGTDHARDYCRIPFPL